MNYKFLTLAIFVASQQLVDSLETQCDHSMSECQSHPKDILIDDSDDWTPYEDIRDHPILTAHYDQGSTDELNSYLRNHETEDPLIDEEEADDPSQPDLTESNNVSNKESTALSTVQGAHSLSNIPTEFNSEREETKTDGMSQMTDNLSENGPQSPRPTRGETMKSPQPMSHSGDNSPNVELQQSQNELKDAPNMASSGSLLDGNLSKNESPEPHPTKRDVELQQSQTELKKMLGVMSPTAQQIQSKTAEAMPSPSQQTDSYPDTRKTRRKPSQPLGKEVYETSLTLASDTQHEAQEVPTTPPTSTKVDDLPATEVEFSIQLPNARQIYYTIFCGIVLACRMLYSYWNNSSPSESPLQDSTEITATDKGKSNTQIPELEFQKNQLLLRQEAIKKKLELEPLQRDLAQMEKKNFSDDIKDRRRLLDQRKRELSILIENKAIHSQIDKIRYELLKKLRTLIDLDDFPRVARQIEWNDIFQSLKSDILRKEAETESLEESMQMYRRIAQRYRDDYDNLMKEIDRERGAFPLDCWTSRRLVN